MSWLSGEETHWMPSSTTTTATVKGAQKTNTAVRLTFNLEMPPPRQNNNWQMQNKDDSFSCLSSNPPPTHQPASSSSCLLGFFVARPLTIPLVIGMF